MVSLESLANSIGRLENLIASRYVTPNLLTLETQVWQKLGTIISVTCTADGEFHDIDVPTLAGISAGSYIYLIEAKINSNTDNNMLTIRAVGGLLHTLHAHLNGFTYQNVFILPSIPATGIISYYIMDATILAATIRIWGYKTVV